MSAILEVRFRARSERRLPTQSGLGRRTRRPWPWALLRGLLVDSLLASGAGFGHGQQ